MSKAPRLVAGLATAVLTISLAACGGGGGGGAVATVNGQSISHAELDNKLESSPAARGVLQNLVMSMLIDQYAKQHNITVGQDEIAKVEDQYKAQYPGDQWTELLKARSLSEQDVQDLIRRQLIIDKAVGSNIKISEKQIKDYFEKNHAQFDKPAQARARHILVPDLKTAQKVEADLKAGKDFATEAKQYSTDPGSRDKGGELGFFRKGAMVQAFDAYAFSAPINKISEPIKSPFGYHIIQVEERKPEQKATLASTHDQIATMLRQQQESPLLQPFYQQLQQNAKISINDPRFEGIFPTPQPAAGAPSAAPTK
ncbi:MAG TPA: peptidylprolyl isomerase [Candidatus Baltobacteraceae bacterium]|nr:peptidylprolyl isomerase [Candidatus Baltobacteraceae bacterium]